ncbi:MAG: signal transduction histidine kinase [Candidatus Azotimanducaceae bacterium]
MFLKQQLLYLWNGGLDPDRAGPNELRERRTISTSILLLAPVGGVVMVINAARGLHGDNPIIGAGLLLVFMALYVQAKWNAPKFAANIGVVGFWGILVLVMLSSGLLGQTWLWLFGVPAIAALLGGLMSGIFWSVVSALSIWGFTALQITGRLTLDDEVKTFDNAYVLGLAFEGTLVLALLCIAVLIFRHAENAAQESLKSSVLSLKSEVHHRALAEENARDSERSKSTLLATMSHELRTPLNGVIGAIQLLIQSDLESEKTEYANVALDSGEILLELINNIMDLSSLESGSIKLEKIAIDLRNFLKKTTAPFEFQARSRDLDFVLDIDESAPHYIMGDPTRLRQLLINLVGNALKFTESGEVSIKAEIKNDRLGIVISDSGIGIPEEAQVSLFEPYVQADSSTTRKYGGSGLGLSIVKKLITAMDGSIAVNSVPGKGSQFTISLPCEVSELKPLEAEEVVQYEVIPLKILVADDNAVNRMVLSRLLEKDGHSVVSVSNGREAVDYIIHHEVDAVLMDIQMPELDGIAATEQIRNFNSEKSTTPIIAITANTSSEAIERMLKSGMNNYVAKPFKYEDLRDVLRLS